MRSAAPMAMIAIGRSAAKGHLIVHKVASCQLQFAQVVAQYLWNPGSLFRLDHASMHTMRSMPARPSIKGLQCIGILEPVATLVTITIGVGVTHGDSTAHGHAQFLLTFAPVVQLLSPRCEPGPTLMAVFMHTMGNTLAKTPQMLQTTCKPM